MLKRGDVVKRIDGNPISSLSSPCLTEDRMCAMVVIGQGDIMHEYAWHYNYRKDQTIPNNIIGLKIGLFPTFEPASEFIKVNDNKIYQELEEKIYKNQKPDHVN